MRLIVLKIIHFKLWTLWQKQRRSLQRRQQRSLLRKQLRKRSNPLRISSRRLSLSDSLFCFYSICRTEVGDKSFHTLFGITVLFHNFRIRTVELQNDRSWGISGFLPNCFSHIALSGCSLSWRYPLSFIHNWGTHWSNGPWTNFHPSIF